jgi:hypothetical protein
VLFVAQLPFIKKKFLTYADFGNATFDKLFSKEELKHSIKYTANYLHSAFVRNNGNGKSASSHCRQWRSFLHSMKWWLMILITMEILTFALTRMILGPTPPAPTEII